MDDDAEDDAEDDADEKTEDESEEEDDDEETVADSTEDKVVETKIEEVVVIPVTIEIKELGDNKEVSVNAISENPKILGDLFKSSALAKVPDSRKQEIFADIMKERISVMKNAEASDKATGRKGPPPKPELAFEPADSTGALAMAFNSGMAGLEFINEIGMEVSTTGSVSELFAGDDEVDAAESLDR